MSTFNVKTDLNSAIGVPLCLTVAYDNNLSISGISKATLAVTIAVNIEEKCDQNQKGMKKVPPVNFRYKKP